MKISVIGCGWLGFPLALELKNDGHSVSGSTTSEDKLPVLVSYKIEPYIIRLTPQISGACGDFFNTELLIINIPPRNQKGDDSFHFKQISSLRDQIIANQIPKVLFVSSTGVYPNVNGPVNEEDASEKATTRGGVRLVEIEHFLQSIPQTEITVLRFGGLYGPERDPSNFFKNRSEIPGRNNPVNMIHLEDAIGVIKTVIAGNHWSKTYNACSPDERTREKFYQDAAKASGRTFPIFSDDPLDFKKVVPTKLISETGYQFKY